MNGYWKDEPLPIPPPGFIAEEEESEMARLEPRNLSVTLESNGKVRTADNPTGRQIMSNKVLLMIGGVPVYQDDDGSVHWNGEMTIDADGCPHAYGPNNSGLDYTANAGYDGNWWGIVTDSNGNPYIQQKSDGKEKAPWPGYYVSTTAYLVSGFDKYDARRYVDSEFVCFAVVPGNVRMSISPKFLGCKVLITDNKTGKDLECACCDVGPSNHLGEASMAAAKFFGLSSSPKSGGSSDRTRWHYRMWAGTKSKDYPLQ